MSSARALAESGMLAGRMHARAGHHDHITDSLGNDFFARVCLMAMVKGLHFNLSQCHSSNKRNPPTKPGYISLFLEYACFQWAYHILSLPRRPKFEGEINDVFRRRFLLWLEVTSVISLVRRPTAMLNIAVYMVRLSSWFPAGR